MVLINKDPAVADSAVIKFVGVGAAGPYKIFEFGANGRLAAAGTGDINNGTLTRTVPPYTASLIEYTPTAGIGPALSDDPEVDAGTPPVAPVVPTPKGCGCSAGLAGMWVLGLLPLLRLRRQHRHDGADLTVDRGPTPWRVAA